MNEALRRKALLGSLAATLAAVVATAWWTEDGDLIQLAGADGAHVAVPPAARTGFALAESRRAPDGAGALLRRDLWAPPSRAALLAWGGSPPPPPVPQAVRAAPPPPSAPAPPPAAPQLAYRFVGRIIEDGRQHALLLAPQGDLKVVAENDVIDGQWRVERIAELGVDLIWTPGAQRLRLAIATT